MRLLEMTRQKKGGKNVPEEGRQRKTAPVQIERELARMVAVIASHRGITQSEFLSPYIRQYVLTQYRAVRAKMGEELEETD